MQNLVKLQQFNLCVVGPIYGHGKIKKWRKQTTSKLGNVDEILQGFVVRVNFG